MLHRTPLVLTCAAFSVVVAVSNAFGVAPQHQVEHVAEYHLRASVAGADGNQVAVEIEHLGHNKGNMQATASGVEFRKGKQKLKIFAQNNLLHVCFEGNTIVTKELELSTDFDRVGLVDIKKATVLDSGEGPLR